MKRIFGIIAVYFMVATPVLAEVVTYLIEERVVQEYGFELPEGAEFDVRLAGVEDKEAVTVTDFWHDRNSGQFIANVVLDEGTVSRVTGLATMTVNVPVPLRRLLPGEIILSSDLQVISLPYTRVASFSLMDEDDIVGMEVRRVLSQGRPVMQQYVAPPLIIDRGDRVEIRYSHKGMNLSAPGKAISSASKGEDAKIVNLISNKSVIATATEEGIVEIIR